MLYETIDSGQIDDIMAGRKPREPEDWGDSDDTTQANADVEQQESPSSPIGGPAGEH
jgi:cell division protease FtsH